jgi:hypothetical protein
MNIGPLMEFVRVVESASGQAMNPDAKIFVNAVAGEAERPFTHGAMPFLATLDGLARSPWVRVIERDPRLAADVLRKLNWLWQQQIQPHQLDHYNERAVRFATRSFLDATQNAAHLDYVKQRRAVLESRKLPHLQLGNEKVIYYRSSAAVIDDFTEAGDCYQEGRALTPSRRRSCEEPHHRFVHLEVWDAKQEYPTARKEKVALVRMSSGREGPSSATQQMSIGMEALPAAVVLLQMLSSLAASDLAQYKDEELLALMKAGLATLYGISSRYSEQVGVQCEGEFGRLDEGRLLIRIGAAVDNSTEAVFHDGVFELPLAPELRLLTAEIIRRHPQKLLSDILPGGAAFNFPARCLEVIRRRSEDFNFPTNAFHEVFAVVGIVVCDFPVTVIGLVRGFPVGPYRGQQAYTSRETQQLVRVVVTIQNVLRQWANLPEESIPTTSDRGSLGARALIWKDDWEDLMTTIDRATSRNEGLACLDRLLSLLSLRKVLAHQNPVLLFRSEPFPCLRVEEKLVEGRMRVRYIFLSPALVELLEACLRCFGTRPFLPYEKAGQVVGFEGLAEADKKRVRQIWALSLLEPAGRISFFNFLLDENAPAILCDEAMGHGCSEFQLDGFSRLASRVEVLRKFQTFLLPRYEKYRVNRAARALGAKLLNLYRP